ncbi:MAG: hypothetical protein K2N80_05105 [Lachnospiraceae bacterium]|nr:hypothetical protein [Lachnospiraceae bacterium]
MKGAVFGDKYTKDYGAIMNYARITPPAVKENYVDIPGGDSSLDLTETVGGIVYNDGMIDFKFTLFDFSKKENMKNDLHGKRLRIILEREPEFYYDGRLACSSDGWVAGRYELLMNAKVKPYKFEIHETLHTERMNGTAKEMKLINTRMPVMPRITVDGDIYLTYDGSRYHMETGVYQIPEITLYEGLNRIKLSGKGTVRLEYRKGRLI